MTAIASWITLVMQLVIMVVSIILAKLQRDLRNNDQKLYEQLADLRARVAELEQR